MDLLYQKYSNPLEFMKIYIDQGRFGEFVLNISEMEYKRKQEEAEKENENRLWSAYVHSMSDKSFIDWKKGLTENQKNEPEKLSMTNDEISDVKDQARGILSRISPV